MGMKETIKRLQAELRARDQLIASLLDRIAVLERNSSTSSKPPSSDIVKPPKPDPKDTPGKKTKRKKGAQPGHKQNLRKPLAPELIDEIVQLELTACPDCGHKLDLVQGESELRITNYEF